MMPKYREPSAVMVQRLRLTHSAAGEHSRAEHQAGGQEDPRAQIERHRARVRIARPGSGEAGVRRRSRFPRVPGPPGQAPRSRLAAARPAPAAARRRRVSGVSRPASCSSARRCATSRCGPALSPAAKSRTVAPKWRCRTGRAISIRVSDLDVHDLADPEESDELHITAVTQHSLPTGSVKSSLMYGGFSM